MPSGATGIAFRCQVVAQSGASGARPVCVYAVTWPAVCSHMLWPPASTQMVLCTIRAVIASA